MSSSNPSNGPLSEPRGLLNFGPDLAKQLFREAPDENLSHFVEHFWGIRWDLRETGPHRQESLPYASVHLTFTTTEARIVGVVKGRFSVLLEGKGRVFGIKFKPGGFYPFYRQSVSKLTNKVIPPQAVFGADVKVLESRIDRVDEAADNDPKDRFHQMIELASNFLVERLPAIDPNVADLNRIIDFIMANTDITQVDQLIGRLGLRKRALQRLFSQYVGVSPKWVIQRYRLHEALEKVGAGEEMDWARMAQDLGYFDQSHFIRDFKTFVGKSPAEYARSIG